MARLPTLFFFSFFLQPGIQIALCRKHHTNFFDICKPSRCNKTGPEIRFPYRLDSSPLSCGLPGFELTCSSKNNDTLLTLTKLGSMKVKSLDYTLGSITVELDDSWPSCILENLTLLQEKIVLIQNLTMMNLTTPVYQHSIQEVILLTCPEKFVTYMSYELAGPVSCMSSAGKYVYVVPSDVWMDVIPPKCVVLTSGFNITLQSGLYAPQFEVAANDFLVRGLVTLEASPRTDFMNLNVKIISATSATAFVILLSISASLFYFFRKSGKEKETRLKVERFLATYKVTKPTRYTFNELKKITKHFKNKLGQGGFGSVYKGELSNGLQVAVKMLERSKGVGEEFINEVATIGRIHHVNIVRLLGFCYEGTRRALVYEFMSNNSLEKYVITRKNSSALSLRMEKLLQIAIGIARGIEYLHQGCNEQILHFDIKPHNILLDDNLNPKIADFGLAKLCAKDQSIITMTAARGTMGYIAPEVYSRNFGTVSYKSDVYSFGMLLLEMVVGKKGEDPEIENQSDEYFPELIYNQLVLGQQLHLEIQMSSSQEEIVKKLIIIAFWA
ncbi:hypothetical protein LUZ60_012766 [Juncus effusus]|nr:hypothetical protein LUZ60_012766 [Juncus effusus]